MSGATLACTAPAKINLFLHVTGRRADGYHFLETAFRMLDRCDQLVLERRADGLVRRISDLAGVPHDSDLVVRAARLLQAHTGCTFGVDIALEKHLPMGGGLGGGSSDAASVLLGLNRLWGLNLPRASLQELGLALGADVPFFIFGQSAFAAGVGEALRPLPLAPAWYVVVEPPVSISTAEIFCAEGLTRNTETIIMPGFVEQQLIECFAKQGSGSSELFGRNDLQPVACQRYPVVQAAIDALSEFGQARMSGSGACVFLPCGSAEEAAQVENALKADWRVWFAPGLDQHPFYDYASC